MDKDNVYGYETAAPDRYSRLKTFAHNNRKEMTPSEERLWNALRHLSCGYKFRRQHAIGDFIADFVCLEKRLVVEVDGEYHNSPEQQADDATCSLVLEQKGFHVIRFSNDVVDKSLDKVLHSIKEYLFNH